MKQTTKAVRNKVIDRFFLTANELPHSIEYLGKESHWKVYLCKSANYTMEIGYSNMLHEQAIRLQ
jgi:hypothetical protein